MTNLKDKLSASLRQAKEGGQAPAKPVAKAINKTQRKATPAQAVNPKAHNALSPYPRLSA